MTPTQEVVLSAEQQRLVDLALEGRDVIVEATVGSGKTTVIQEACNALAAAEPGIDIGYFTYSRLLKAEAQRRVDHAHVQNFHGFVYPPLRRAGIRAGISESVAVFNRNFDKVKTYVPVFDVIVVDEYQDLNEDYAEMLRHLKSLNVNAQVIMVGDPDQKVHSNTRLDAQAFAREFCCDPVLLRFSQSFRMGQSMAGKLAASWGKPVVGSNDTQRVEHISATEATAKLAAMRKDPSQILCLGKRNGMMVNVLNFLESQFPKNFNKRTVHASIRDSDNTSRSDLDGAAIFTTFDSAKGLERPTVFVFDYDDRYWQARTRYPDADLQVLRNTFLVAASRGKNHVYFVSDEPLRPGHIGGIRTTTFANLPPRPKPRFTEPMTMYDAFDFKLAEDVRDCFEALEVTRLDDGNNPPIEIETMDGLIDLSPVVGNYQEAVFFDRYSKADAMRFATFGRADLKKKFKTDTVDEQMETWRHCLLRTAAETRQDRYRTQVSLRPTPEQSEALCQRLGQHLSRADEVQVPVVISGTVTDGPHSSSPLRMVGRADVIHEGRVWELKYVSELTHPMFCQLGLYLVGLGHEEGVLFNTRTGERWLVRIPDPDTWMDLVARCVTKGHYEHFEAAEAREQKETA